jgi:pimeloyl-ACP methyl ester carboxylesterase
MLLLQHTIMRWTLLALALWIGCGGPPAPVATPERPQVNGPQLWVQVAGHGDPTVVFEAGGGDDSSVWAKIEPQIRMPSSVRTVLYDRAGLGHSAPAPGAYRIDDEAAALKRVLDRSSVLAPVILVAHSYGGFIATLVAATDARIAGVVLVDANLAEYFDDAALARLKARYAPQFGALQRDKPALAQVMIPLINAYPDTVRRVRAVTFPPAIPVIDIVAEHSWGDTEVENAAMRRVHDAFVAASPEREIVVATGSGHNVMRDRPELLVAEIARMVRIVRRH